MIRNRKAHIDPICIVPTTLLVIVGGIMLSWVFSGAEVLMPALLGFAVLAMVSPLVHLFHHGLSPISGIVVVLMLLVSIFLMRFALGNPDPVGEFYFENLGSIIPMVIALDVIKLVVH